MSVLRSLQMLTYTLSVWGYKEFWIDTCRMADKSIRDKLKQQTPEEQAAMDASIRASRRSVPARRMVAEIKAALAEGKSPAEIEVELCNWKEEYPRLFDMVLDPGHSEAMLNAMLGYLEAVESGAQTTHSASVAVGTHLVNQFVRPKLGMDPAPLPDSVPQSASPAVQRKAGSH